MKKLLVPLSLLCAAALAEAQPPNGREIATSATQIQNVLISPDGQCIAAQLTRVKLNADDKKVGDGSEIAIWDAARGQKRFVTGKTKERPIGFSWDSQALITVANNDQGSTEINSLDVLSGRSRGKIQTSQPSSVVLFPDGKTLLTIGKLKPTAEVMLLATGVVTGTFDLDESKFRGFRPSAQSPFQAIVETGRRSIGLYTRDLKTGKSKTVNLPGMTQAIIMPDGKQVLAAGEGRLRSFDAAGKPRWTAAGDVERFSVAGKTIVAIEPRGKIVLFDAATGRKVRTVDTGLKGAISAALARDGKSLVAAGARDNGFGRWVVVVYPLAPK